MSRIGARFDALGASGRKALVTFVTAGDPTADITLEPSAGGPIGRLVATIDDTGAACRDYAPDLPYWGFPLAGVGALVSTSYLLRRRI